MGKNWRGSSGGGGGGGKGGGNLKGKGHGSILGTCDAGRERECSKELVNIFSQVMEWIDEGKSDNEEGTVGQSSSSGKSYDSLADEIKALKNAATRPVQPIVSVDIVS